LRRQLNPAQSSVQIEQLVNQALVCLPRKSPSKVS